MENKVLILAVLVLRLTQCWTIDPSSVISADVNCNIANEWDIQLGTREHSFVVLKGSNNGVSSRGSGNCKFTIIPNPEYGVIAYVQEMNLLRGAFETCTDYVNITYNYVMETSKMCNNHYKGNDYTTTRKSANMVVNFYTQKRNYQVYSNFEIIFTQYQSAFCSKYGYDEFKCANGRCIYEGLECDGRNNCGDNSDEICATKFGTIIGSTIGTIAVVAIVVGLVCCIRRRRNNITTRTTVIGGIATQGAIVTHTIPVNYTAQQTAYPTPQNHYEIGQQYPTPQSQYPIQLQSPTQQQYAPPPQYHLEPQNQQQSQYSSAPPYSPQPQYPPQLQNPTQQQNPPSQNGTEYDPTYPTK